MQLIKPKDIDAMINRLDIKPVLKSSKRQVRWLYKNSNKCLYVYDEKLVQQICQAYETKIFKLKA